MPLVAKEHDPLNAGDPETQAQLETLARKTSNPDQEPEVLGLHLRLLPGEPRLGASVWWFVGQVWIPLGSTREILA